MKNKIGNFKKYRNMIEYYDSIYYSVTCVCCGFCKKIEITDFSKNSIEECTKYGEFLEFDDGLYCDSCFYFCDETNSAITKF